MQYVQIILRQSQVAEQIISKHREYTKVFYAIAYIENIVILTHYEEIINYFIVYLEYFHSC